MRRRRSGRRCQSPAEPRETCPRACAYLTRGRADIGWRTGRGGRVKSALRMFAAAVGIALHLPLMQAAMAQQPEPANPPAFKPEQLDQLLAPIALYPDELIAQILTAATYPLEIVMASRWVADPKNAALKADALVHALDQ